MNGQFKHLLSPMKIGKVTIKNRMSVAPMGAGYGNRMGAHGEYRNSAIEYMIERARGGFGLFYAGSILTDKGVDPHDDYSHFLNNKADFKKRALRLTERASYYDMKVIQQISFGCGRNEPGQYSCSQNPRFGNPGVVTPELTRDQIKQKIDYMVEAAELMKQSGFIGVEMHAMHWGYLLDQFAMSIFNHREDEYGGCLENRLRVAKELVQGIKQVCGDDFVVGMRMGLKSYINDQLKSDLTGENEAGRTLEEAVEIAKLLETYGYDVLSVDAGIYESFYRACPPLYIENGYVIPMAEKVKEAVHIPVLCGTRMNDPFETEKAIADGKIDGAVLGRPSLADPYYVKKLEMGKPEKIRPCIGCLVGCMGKIRSGQYMACAVNPTLMQETTYGAPKALVSKKVAVIGGGISGMEVARTAKMRGHDVNLYEKTDQLGGLLIAAGAHDFKKEVRQLKDWYIGEIKDLGIPVKYNAEMSIGDIKELGADTVVLAMGSKPIMPEIEGIHHPKCISGVDALKQETDIGQDIVIVGGGLVGCETALDFAKQGKHVTIVEGTERVLGNSAMIPLMVAQAIPDMLDYYKVEVKAGCMIQAINDEGAVIVPSAGGAASVISADKVIMSIGLKSERFDVSQLQGNGFEVFMVGDSLKVGNVYTCIAGAYDIARRI